MKKSTGWVIISVFLASIALIGSGVKKREAEEVSEKGFYKLTQQDIEEIFETAAYGEYFDQTVMTEPVTSSGPESVLLTEEEKEKIRGMNLVVAEETWGVNDPMEQMIDGLEEVMKELNVRFEDKWLAPEISSEAQIQDWQRFEAIAGNYDGFFTIALDQASGTDIIGRIMEKTMVTFIVSPVWGIPFDDPNFGGFADADAYLGGLYSAEAAIKILNDSGTLGTMGWAAGRDGVFHSVAERYRAWNDVFAKYPDLTVKQTWFDNPDTGGEVVAGFLASNPDIRVLLIDWSDSPAIQAMEVLGQLGLKAWEDIVIVTMDTADGICIPMALDGPDNNMIAAYVPLTWYHTGRLWGLVWAKNIVTGGKGPKYVTSPPMPVTVYENLETMYKKSVPKGWPIPKEVEELKNQWPLGVEDVWDF
jgi:ABC-type sugar transport system substrate-binding protein